MVKHQKFEHCSIVFFCVFCCTSLSILLWLLHVYVCCGMCFVRCLSCIFFYVCVCVCCVVFGIYCMRWVLFVYHCVHGFAYSISFVLLRMCVGLFVSKQDILAKFSLDLRLISTETTPPFTHDSITVSSAWELTSVSVRYSQGDGVNTSLSSLMYCTHE